MYKRLFRQAMKELLQLQDPVIPGYMDYPLEGKWLLWLTEILPEGSLAVEVGSLCGKSSRYLAVGTYLSGSRLICVDPWKGLPEDKTGQWADMTHEETLNIWRTIMDQSLLHEPVLLEHVKPLRTTSQDAAKHWRDGKIDLLFIDGDHERATQDYEDFLKHLSDHAVVLLDDIHDRRYGLTNPAACAQQMLREGWKPLGTIGKIGALTRDPEYWSIRSQGWSDQTGDQGWWGSWQNRIG